jgi:hypothetical protein
MVDIRAWVLSIVIGLVFGFCLYLLFIAHTLAAARQVRNFGHGEKHHDGSIIHFLIAAAVVLAAAAIIAFIVGKVILGWFQELKANTSGQVPLCDR